MKTNQSKTIIRKHTDNLDTSAIVSDYADGSLSIAEIAAKHKTTDNNVSLITKRFWKSLTNMREARALKAYPEALFDARDSLAELNHTELINPEFLECLSEPSASLLSDQEAAYCWSYVHTGDIKESLEVSKLHTGIFRERKRDSRFSYDRAIMLRGLYLNSKPNIASYIKELRELKLSDANVGRSRIQSELIEQLEYMKASGNPKYKPAILRTIELLGKTVGAFVERIEVTEINPANALDELIELAKQAEVHQLPEGPTGDTGVTKVEVVL